MGSVLPEDAAKNLSIVVPAGGQGTRMRQYNHKSLVRVGLDGETVLARQVRMYQERFPGAQVIVVVGHRAHKVVEVLPPDVEVVFNEDFATTNVAWSIHLGLQRAIHDDVLVVYGDIVFNDLVLGDELFCSGSAVMVDPLGSERRTEVGMTITDGRVNHLDYGLALKWGHVSYLEGDVRERFESLLGEPRRRRQYTYEILNTIIDKGTPIAGISPSGSVLCEIDTCRDIPFARNLARNCP